MQKYNYFLCSFIVISTFLELTLLSLFPRIWIVVLSILLYITEIFLIIFFSSSNLFRNSPSKRILLVICLVLFSFYPALQLGTYVSVATYGYLLREDLQRVEMHAHQHPDVLYEAGLRTINNWLDPVELVYDPNKILARKGNETQNGSVSGESFSFSGCDANASQFSLTIYIVHVSC